MITEPELKELTYELIPVSEGKQGGVMVGRLILKEFTKIYGQMITSERYHSLKEGYPLAGSLVTSESLRFVDKFYQWLYLLGLDMPPWITREASFLDRYKKWDPRSSSDGGLAHFEFLLRSELLNNPEQMIKIAWTADYLGAKELKEMLLYQLDQVMDPATVRQRLAEMTLINNKTRLSCDICKTMLAQYVNNTETLFFCSVTCFEKSHIG